MWNCPSCAESQREEGKVDSLRALLCGIQENWELLCSKKQEGTHCVPAFQHWLMQSSGKPNFKTHVFFVFLGIFNFWPKSVQLPATGRDNKYILVISDYFTKWTETVIGWNEKLGLLCRWQIISQIMKWTLNWWHNYLRLVFSVQSKLP